MKNKILLLFGFFVISNTCLQAQSYEELIDDIRSNNLEIKANQQWKDSEDLLLRTGLNPSDPELEYGYYPGSVPDMGNKTTFEVNQALEFPTVYSKRNKANASLKEKNQYEIEFRQQQILLDFSISYIEIVYLNKIAGELDKRMESARDYLEAFQQRFEKNDATILDVNKAKLRVMDLQNQIRLNNALISKHKEILRQMNNGAVNISSSEYPELTLEDFESLKNEFREKNPLFKSMTAESTYASQQIKLHKSEWWPDILVGYGSETILQESFRGFKLGLSVPLWQDRNTIKYARAYENYALSHQQNIEAVMQSALYQQYLEAEALDKNLADFESGLGELDSIELLEKSLELGQITYVQYLVEISYFYTIYDSWLELEKEYHQTLAQLYAFKL